jgi:hypothetical protein
MASNEDLHAWIEDSKQHRRALEGVVIALTAIALCVFLANARLGLVALFADAVIGVAGFWILGSHIADWEGQLALRRARARAREARVMTGA